MKNSLNEKGRIDEECYKTQTHISTISGRAEMEKQKAQFFR